MDHQPYAGHPRYAPLSSSSTPPPSAPINFYHHNHNHHHSPLIAPPPQPQQQQLPQQQLLRPHSLRETYDPQFYFKPNNNNNNNNSLIENNYHHSNPRSQSHQYDTHYHHPQVTKFVDNLVYRELEDNSSNHNNMSWYNNNNNNHDDQRKEVLSPDEASYYRGREYEHHRQSDSDRSSRDIGNGPSYSSLEKDMYLRSRNYDDQYGELTRSNGRQVINQDGKWSHGRTTTMRDARDSLNGGRVNDDSGIRGSIRMRDARDSLNERVKDENGRLESIIMRDAQGLLNGGRVNDEGRRLGSVIIRDARNERIHDDGGHMGSMKLRDVRDSLNERVNDDGRRLVSNKHEYRGSDSGRYGGSKKGSSREGSYDYNRTPTRNQPQKKSALLRIQRANPSYKNKEDEKPCYNKDKKDNLEGDRKRNDMELDVSFKSNSLVAKAVLTPPSSGGFSESSLTPRNSKIRKVLTSEKQFSNTPVSKPYESKVKLKSSVHVVNGPSSADKGAKQSEEKVTCTGNGNEGSTSANQFSNGAKVSTQKRKVEEPSTNRILHEGGNDLSSVPKDLDLDKDDKNLDSAAKDTVLDKAGSNTGLRKKVMFRLKVPNKGNGAVNKSSTTVVKKKKIVKKVVKKVVNPNSKLPHTQPSKKQEESLNNSSCNLLSAVESVKVTCLEKSSPIVGILQVPTVDMQPCPSNELIDNSDKVTCLEESSAIVTSIPMPPVDMPSCSSNEATDNCKVDTALQSLVPNEIDCTFGSNGCSPPKISGKRKLPPCLLGSSRASVSIESETVNRSINASLLDIPIEDKSKTDASLLDLSSSIVTSTSDRSGDVVNSGDVDTTLSLSVKDFSHVRDSSVTQFYAGQHPSTDEVRVMDRSSSEMTNLVTSDFNISISGISEENKRRKIAASHFEISSPRIHDEEVPASDNVSIPGKNLQVDSIDDLLQAEDRTTISNINDTMCNTELPHVPGKILSSLENSSSGGSIHAQKIDSISGFEEAVFLCAPSCSPSELVDKEMEKTTVLEPASDHQNDIPVMNSSNGDEMDVDDDEKQPNIPNETSKPMKVLEQPSINNIFPLGKDFLSSVPKQSVVLAVSDDVIISNTSNEQLKPTPSVLSDLVSLENTAASGLNSLNCKVGLFSLEKNDNIPDQNQKSNTTGSVSPQTTKSSLKSDNATGSDNSVAKKIGAMKSQKPKNTIPIPNHASIPKAYPGRSSFVLNATKSTVPSGSVKKARTWCRSSQSIASTLPEQQNISSSVQPPRPLQKRASGTCYIRKGNSLVRKPAHGQGSHSVYQLNSLVVDEVKKTLPMGAADDTEQRPRTPLLAVSSKVSNSSEDCGNSPVGPTSSCETMSGPMTVNEVPSEDTLIKAIETSANQPSSGETLSDPKNGNLNCSNTKQITYVKRKSNQLIATSSQNAINNNSDSNYYVRSKNQLIRTQLETHDDTAKSDVQTVPLLSMQSCGKKRSHKVAMKTRKPSKLSLVWTLRGTQVNANDRYSMHKQILPHLVPWKRPIYRKSLKQYLGSTPNSNSLSTVSWKLQLSRKRETIYTRSAHGFSLRKSRVLSIGGSNLKWSKSIEKNSKKANEEATLAVVEAEKMKREKNTAGRVLAAAEKRKNSSRERVFRIGSSRYKMDPTRRSLQRISDNESSLSAACPSENNVKKSYVPRRLTIGNNEYIRIGNGNRLVRNPKKRTRILASEKIRWSLHTARLRLLKKHQYCQFFTRFGKCNKNDEKNCPYIHDPSKIAVCTKFLTDMCSDPNCLLTHQVIPERMPDCSFYLLGLCTNKKCSYRHVHVNPKASPCEGFLRGFCANGNECRKKHSYNCPSFEATGSCDQGLNCKLHHPKTLKKGNKNKRIKRWQNVERRYFGSPSHVINSEPQSATVSGKNSEIENGSIIVDGRISEQESGNTEQENGNMDFDGRISDFIPLSFCDEEPEESSDEGDPQQTSFCEGDPLDLQEDDFDELIKPIRIMRDV
ncbi:hypothetical protein ACFE04_004491 [Oxalis oulophora]